VDLAPFSGHRAVDKRRKMWHRGASRRGLAGEGWLAGGTALAVDGGRLITDEP
jgi:hypothetical protein